MAPIINAENFGSVDEGTLTGTGRGGILSDGFLREDPIASYLDEEEKPVFVLSNGKKGVAYEQLDGDESGRVRPGDGYRAFAVGTDSRLLFLVGDTRNGDEGDHSVSVPLADVEVVETSTGLLANELAVTTATDVRWRFACRGDLDGAVDYLDAASMTWMAIERQLERARDAVVAATQSFEDQAYREAVERVREAMAATDEARRRERTLCEDGVAAVAARIERMEDRIRDVRVRTLEGRATHRMDEAEAHWRRGDYDSAHDAFTAAHDDLVEALAVSETDFGDSADLRTRLARVERNLAALERAPVERGDEYSSQAHEVEDLSVRGDLLEDALTSYRAALELDWGRSAKRFEGDTDRVREQIDTVAGDLVETRRRFATDRVARGDELATDGRTEEAAACYREARDALAGTTDVARELVPDEVDALTDHVAAVERRLVDLEGFDWGGHPANTDEPSADESDAGEDVDGTGPGEDETGPTKDGGEAEPVDDEAEPVAEDGDSGTAGSDRRRRTDPEDDQTPVLG